VRPLREEAAEEEEEAAAAAAAAAEEDARELSLRLKREPNVFSSRTSTSIPSLPFSLAPSRTPATVARAAAQTSSAQVGWRILLVSSTKKEFSINNRNLTDSLTRRAAE
jgi:hypothetical protein